MSQITNGVNNMNMNNMNNMNINPNLTSPPITSPRIFSPTHATNTTARASLNLKNSYSTNDASGLYTNNQTHNNNTYQQTQKHTYATDDSYNNKYYTNYNPGTFDNIIQKHTVKNQQHKQWINQQQQQQPIQNTIQQKHTSHDDGALPNAPQVAAIPEPELHFQLNNMNNMN
eukprot:348474_1